MPGVGGPHFSLIIATFRSQTPKSFQQVSSMQSVVEVGIVYVDCCLSVKSLIDYHPGGEEMLRVQISTLH